MRIAATADLHGFFPYVPDCDVCVLAGDIIGATSTEEEAIQWAQFRAWAIELEARGIKLVWIAGNHEFVLERHPRFAEQFPGIYLCDSGATINGVKFWGTPWTPWFHNWAFNAPMVDPGEEFLDEKFRQIPRDTDVLISHGPPAGFHDIVGRRHIGSTALNVHCQRVMPRLAIYGHIHHGFGVETVGERGLTCTMANVSHTKSEGGRYYPENPPVLFNLEITKNEKEFQTA